MILEEVEIWANQFNVPITEATVDIDHLQQTKNGNYGAVPQPAGLLLPQQTQVQLQAGYYSLQPMKLTDNYAKNIHHITTC